MLAAAAATDGQTQNDLVRATGIDRSTLADLVARMLAKGLLERQRSATDARANTVRLSDAGRQALNASSGPAAAADEKLLSYLPAKKRDGFLKALGVLAGAADNPSEVEPKPVKEKTAKIKPPKGPRDAEGRQARQEEEEKRKGQETQTDRGVRGLPPVDREEGSQLGVAATSAYVRHGRPTPAHHEAGEDVRAAPSVW